MKRRIGAGCLLLMMAAGLSGCTSEQLKNNAGHVAGVVGGLATNSLNGAVSSGISLINDNFLGGNRYVNTIGKIVGTGVDAGTGNWVGAGQSGAGLIINTVKDGRHHKPQPAPAPVPTSPPAPASRPAPEEGLLSSDQE